MTAQKRQAPVIGSGTALWTDVLA